MAMARIGYAIAVALAIGISELGATGHRIEFGPPGPLQTIRFADAVASVSVTFRVSRDARYDGGPAGVSPSISSGSLTVRAFGTRRRYDLSTILPIATDRVELSEEKGCGTATALSRRGRYLVVEATLAQKGCAALAAFIDLRDGRVAKEAIFDSAWAHRFDVRPYRASGVPVRIVRVERVVTDASRSNSDGTSSTVPWSFSVVHATDARGATLAFAVDPSMQSDVDQRAFVFTAGDAALVGSSDTGDRSVLVTLYADEPIVRPGRAAEARLETRQTPTPDDLQARFRRTHWFDEAAERARRGDIVGAVDAFATMTSFHGGDEEIDTHDAAMLAACRALVRRVRAGTVTARVAGAAFSYGCVLQPKGKEPPKERASLGFAK